ncbi:MAG: hypothetical protein RIF33_25660 [Cyclobacteriaceae bacterium]
MRVLLIVLLIAGSGITARAHEFKMGLFEINREGDELSLLVRLDRLNLLEAITCSDYNQVDQCFQDYVGQHMVLLINEQPIVPQLENAEITDDFVEISYFLTDDFSKVEMVEFTNTCLVAEVDDHINLFRLNITDKSRTFRLDKDRMSTKITYP